MGEFGYGPIIRLRALWGPRIYIYIPKYVGFMYIANFYLLNAFSMMFHSTIEVENFQLSMLDSLQAITLCTSETQEAVI